jgi:hypothetical protein
MISIGKHLRRFGASALLAGFALTTGAGIASAQGWYGPPPPPPRYEQHAYRAGYVWAGGHWRRAGGQWVWVSGHYVGVAYGRHWVSGHWAVGPQGRRYWRDGHWS